MHRLRSWRCALNLTAGRIRSEKVLIPGFQSTRYIAIKSNCRFSNIQPQLDWATRQVRNYAPQSTRSNNICWNCKKAEDCKDSIICASCGYLQDVDMEINYFDLLNCPKKFNLEAQNLTRRFRQLQALVHPDKFSNKTSREQTNSADWSSLINKAYKTLSVPMERGQYMLTLQGEQLPEDNSALNKAFLMEMMDRNEEVDDAETADELQRINEGISQELNAKIDKLNIEFAKNSIETAKGILVEMKYLLSIQKTIKKKQQALMGSF